MGKPDFAVMFPHRWTWPLVEAGEILLFMVARAARRRTARLDARLGVHSNHLVCRNGKAVDW